MSSSPDDPLFIAQQVVCYYPISDYYARTPRYLYYTLLVLSFIFSGQGWLSHVFLGGAAAYAATAAIQVFILIAKPTPTPPVEQISIPFVNGSLFQNTPAIYDSLVSGERTLPIEPDFLELDLDAICAVVVTAYLVGLPFQCWSRTTRASRILHLLVFLWNMLMLAAVVCTLLVWPSINTAEEQYRFCYADALDAPTLGNQGWQPDFWRGSWNETIWNMFVNESVWERLSDNCYYPCFNTTQILRQSTSLKSTTFTSSQTAGSLHSPDKYADDYFQPIVWSAFIAFSAAQGFLMIVARFKICTRIPIYDPRRLWKERRKILGSLAQDGLRGIMIIRRLVRNSWAKLRGKLPRQASGFPIEYPHKHPAVRFVIDVVTLIVIIASMLVGPPTIVAFVAWIEWYIHHDGDTNEQPAQVGQWAPLVSVSMVLFAALAIRLKHWAASEEEVKRDVEHTREHLTHLEQWLEKKSQQRRDKEEQHSPHDSKGQEKNVDQRLL